MSDETLRRLERRWKETGTSEDAEAYLRGRVQAQDFSILRMRKDILRLEKVVAELLTLSVANSYPHTSMIVHDSSLVAATVEELLDDGPGRLESLLVEHQKSQESLAPPTMLYGGHSTTVEEVHANIRADLQSAEFDHGWIDAAPLQPSFPIVLSEDYVPEFARGPVVYPSRQFEALEQDHDDKLAQLANLQRLQRLRQEQRSRAQCPVCSHSTHGRNPCAFMVVIQEGEPLDECGCGS